MTSIVQKCLTCFASRVRLLGVGVSLGFGSGFQEGLGIPPNQDLPQPCAHCKLRNKKSSEKYSGKCHVQTS